MAERLNVQPGELVIWASEDAVYFALRTLDPEGVATIAVRHDRRAVEGVVYALTRWLGGSGYEPS